MFAWAHMSARCINWIAVIFSAGANRRVCNLVSKLIAERGQHIRFTTFTVMCLARTIDNCVFAIALETVHMMITLSVILARPAGTFIYI